MLRAHCSVLFLGFGHTSRELHSSQEATAAASEARSTFGVKALIIGAWLSLHACNIMSKLGTDAMILSAALS